MKISIKKLSLNFFRLTVDVASVAVESREGKNKRMENFRGAKVGFYTAGRRCRGEKEAAMETTL